MRSAHKLFYRDGIGAISIDRIAEDAGLTKRAVYYHFADKDALIDAYLSERALLSLRGFQALAGDGEPSPERLMRAFDNLGHVFNAPGFKGCAMQRAAAQSRQSEPVVRQYQADLLNFIARELASGNTPEAAQIALARQLRQIANGALVEAASDDPASVAKSAATLARQLLTPHTDLLKKVRS